MKGYKLTRSPNPETHASGEVIFIKDENGMYITGVGLVWHGGTEESVEIKDGKVTIFKVNGIGIAKE